MVHGKTAICNIMQHAFLRAIPRNSFSWLDALHGSRRRLTLLRLRVGLISAIAKFIVVIVLIVVLVLIAAVTLDPTHGSAAQGVLPLSI